MAERSSRARVYPAGYQDEVRLTAAALVRGEESDWEVANRTLSRCGPSGNGTRPVGTVPLRQWSEDVQRESNRPFGYSTARLYRACAEWRIEHRGTQCEEHGAVCSFHDTMDHVRSNTSADRWDESHLRGIGLASPETRAEAFERLSRDPELAETVQQVVTERVTADTDTGVAALHAIAQRREDIVTQAYGSDPNTHLGIGRATRAHDNEALARRNERVERITRETPSLQRYGELRAITDLQEAVDEMLVLARRITTEILPRAGDLPPADNDPMGMRVWLRSALVDCYAALEPIRVLVATGRSDLDTFLADVLNQPTT